MKVTTEYQFKEIMEGFYDGPHATPEPTDEGPIFLGIKNISEFGGIDLSDIRHISEAEFPKWTKRVTPKQDDLVFSYEATLHRYAIIPKGFRGCLGRRMALIRVNKSIVDVRYLYYYFLSPYWRAFIETKKIPGATVDRISISEFPEYRIQLPPLNIQTKIASIISAYDELIENNKQRIKLLEEMAEEIYKEWFVRFRFPGYENVKVEDGLPEGWERIELRGAIQYYIGGGWGEDQPSNKSTEEAYVIRGTDIPDIKSGKLNFDVLRYHTKSNLSGRQLQENDIVFEVSGGTESQSLGRSVLVSKSVLKQFNSKVICASFCKLIRIKHGISSVYIYQLLQRLYKTGEIMLFQVQSTGISNYKFEDFIDRQRILVPPILIQERFEEIVSLFLEEIQILGEKNRLLQETMDLLLPRLLNGKLNLGDLINSEHTQLSIAAEQTTSYGRK